MAISDGEKKFENMFTRFDTIYERDGHPATQTLLLLLTVTFTNLLLHARLLLLFNKLYCIVL